MTAELTRNITIDGRSRHYGAIGLAVSGRFPGPFFLSSSSLKTLGFVWDGTTRALYVDEQEVIRDGQPQLASSDRGLVIGGGAMSMAVTYFGGMIDDVRIYNRVVRP